MDEVLKNNGWINYDSCNCGGKSTKKYKNSNFPEHLIYYYPKSNTLNILKNRLRVVSGETNEMKIKLKELGLIT